MQKLFWMIISFVALAMPSVCNAKDSAIYDLFSSGVSSLKGQKYAVHQFTQPDGVKIVVINGFKSAECEKLIATFYLNLSKSCPTCAKEYGSCTADVGTYAAVWKNERYSSPYVSSGNLRFVPVGVSASKALAWCDAAVDSYKRGGLPASCVK